MKSSDLYFILFVVAFFFAAFLSINIVTYLLSIFFIIKFSKVTIKLLISYYLPCILLVFIIYIGNIYVINNYHDFSLKGMVKLIYYVFFIPAIVNFYIYSLKYKAARFKYTMWFLFIIGFIYELNIDLQNIGQLTLLLLLSVTEYVIFLKTKRSLSLFFLLTILVITTKKQIIFAFLLFVFFINMKKMIKLFPYLLVGVFIVSIFGGIDKKGVSNSSQKRLEKTFTRDFFTPSTATNPRLYLLVYTLPKAFDESIAFGYGLLRYGSPEAYKSNRDVERGQLNMGNFIPREINPNAVFGSIAADVGLITILMQMGLVGLFFYLFIIWKSTKIYGNFVSGVFMVLLPFFLGGPIVVSVIFPFLVGMIIAGFKLSSQDNYRFKK